MFLQIKDVLVTCIIVIALGPVLAAAPTEEQLLTVHEGLRDALNTQDVESVVSFFLDDATYDYVPLPPTMKGKEEIATFFEDVFTGFPDFHVEQRNELISDNILITECTITGTHMGEIFEIPGTGNPVQLIHMDIYEFEDDKIKQMATYDDAVSFLVQFGVMPMPDLDPAMLVPSIPLPDAEPTGLSPLEAAAEFTSRWNTGDLSGMAKMIHPDANILIAPLGIPLSRNAYVAVGEMMFQGFSEMPMEVVRAIDMGDGWVMTELLITGTNDGPYMGMPATRRSITLRGASLQRYNADGLITDLSSYYDNLTMLVQLGLFPPPDPEANKAVVRRQTEDLWNQGNLDVIDEIYATDYVRHDPLSPGISGSEGVKQLIATYRAAFPDIHFTTEDIIAEGDLVAARWTSTGTQTGDLMMDPPIPATGVQGTSTGISIYRIANGKIVEEWAEWDALGMMEQLGVMPPTREDYSWGAPSEVTGDPGDPAANTALVLYFVQKFWNEQNVAAMDNTHSPDMIAQDPAIPPDPAPYNIYKHVCMLYLAAFPDFRVTVENIIAEADKVAVRWTVNGTHLGSLMGIPPTGRAVTFTGMTIHRLADSKIVENWWTYDALGMMQQITAPPESEPPQE